MGKTRIVRLLEAPSIEARVDAVRNAIWTRNDNLVNEEKRWWPMDVFEDYVIVRQGQILLQVPYSFSDDGLVEFGTPVRVEVEYRPMRVQESTLGAARLVEGEDGEEAGLIWDIEIIRPGWSKNGIYYSREALRAAAPLFEGIRVYYFDDDARGHKKNPLEKAPRFLAGWIEQVTVRPDGALGGRLHFLQEGIARPLRRQLVDAWRRGKTDLFGLSIDAVGTVKAGTAEGRTGKLVESIIQASSVEVVLQPAAGGRFMHLVASATATPEEGETMSKTLKKRLLKFLEARRPNAYAGLEDPEVATIEQIVELIGEEHLTEALGEWQNTGAQTPAASSAPATATSGAEEALRAARLIESRLLLREELRESRLPEAVQRRIAERLEGQVVTVEQIREAIQAERDYLASVHPARPTGLGGPRDGAGISVGAGKLERLQAAFDRALGLEPEDSALRNVRPISLRQLYNEITLGGDPDVTGVLQESTQREMLREAFDSTTLPRIMANTLHRRLVRDYREIDYGERRICTVVSANDFRPREAIRVGYFGDIPTVDPEDADYAELTPFGEESATYTVGQRGALVTITRKMIINDDVGVVAKMTGRLGRAARRTFARFVWSFVTSNPNIYDGTAWFAAGHNNLLTGALSAAQLTAARNLLFNQREPGSNEKLGLDLFLLVVPIDLEETAIAINQSQLVPGSTNNDANRWYHKFGQNNENILVNPFFTDANDWAVFANIADADIIEVAFLNGQEEPELFLADAPTVGQMFVADKIQYKIRHEYGGAVVDYRTAVKSVVA